MAIIVPITTTYNPKGISKAIDDIKKAEGAFNKFTVGTASLGREFKNTGKSLTRNLTLPILGLGAVAVKSFADFDAALTQSTAIMSDVSAQVRDDMSNAARDVAKNLGMSHTAAAESFFFLASAGLDAQQSIAALPQVALFAKAGMFDMALATDLATDAQSALGLTSKDATKNLAGLTRVTDVLVKANTLANATVEQFSSALTNKAGAALKGVGKDIEEGVAVLAAFADQGIKGEEAGTQFAIVLRDLQTRAIKNADAFKKFNVSVFDTNGEMNNLGDIVADLEDALAGMSDQQRKSTLATMGFTDKSMGALQALLGTSDAIKGYEEQLRQAMGTTQTVAEKQLESFTEQVNKLKANITDLAIDVGPTLIDGFIKPLMKSIQNLVDMFRALDADTQKSITKFLVFVAVGGPLLIILGSLLTALSAIGTALGVVGTLVGFLAKQWVGVGVSATGAATASVAATTVIKRALITTGVGALIVGLGFVVSKLYDAKQAANEFGIAKDKALLGKSNDARNKARSEGRNKTPEKTLEEQLKDLNDQMKDLGGTTAPKAEKAVKGLSAAAKLAQAQMSKLSDELSRNNDILAKAKDAYNSFKSGITSVIKGIIDFGSAATAETGTFLENLVAQAAKAQDFGTKVKQLLGMGLSETAISQVLAAGADAGTKIADEIIAGGATIVDQINTLVSATASVAEELGTSAATQFYQAGITAGQALVDGVRAAIAAAGFVINLDGSLTNQRAIDQVNAAVAKAKTGKTKKARKVSKKERTAIENLASSLGVEVPAFANGGIVTRPTLALIGEAGPEAVVPLSGRNAGMGNTYNITINAGMGTNGAQVGREIVDAIKKFEKTSGPVFASA
jgi:TP901 family phage tail tape measure protein